MFNGQGDSWAPTSIEDYISLIENGASEDAVLRGTIFQGLELSDLYEFLDYGLTIYDLLQMNWQIQLLGEKAVLTTQNVNIGGSTINRKYLDGEPAFCLDHDLAYDSGSTYDWDNKGVIENELAWLCMDFWTGTDTDWEYSAHQVAIWAIQAGSRDYDSGVAYANSYYIRMNAEDKATQADYIGRLVESAQGQSAKAAIWIPDDSSQQRLLTMYDGDGYIEQAPRYPSPETSRLTATANGSWQISQTITIDKTATITGEKLSGAKFNIYNPDGNTITVTTDTEGKASYTFTKSGNVSETSGEKKYCSNYSNLSDSDKADMDSQGYYYSEAEARAAAEAEAQTAVNNKINQEISANRSWEVWETAAPTGFTVGSAPASFVLTGNSNKALSFTNIPWKASVYLDKVDGVTGSRLTQAAEFEIREWNGTAYVKSENYSVVRLADGTYTVQATYSGAQQGYIYYTQKNQGKFRIVETKAPAGYILDSDPVDIQITADNQRFVIGNNHPENYAINNSTVFANQPAAVYLSIDKVDRYTANRIANDAEFVVYTKSGDFSQPVTFTRQSDGTYKSSAIYYADTVDNANYGLFYMVEQTAPNGMYGDWKDDSAEKVAGSENNKVVYEFSVMGDLSNNGQTIVIANDTTGSKFWNEHQYGSVTLYKYDNEAEANNEDGTRVTQGDATTLNGAVYGLYANEDIYHSDGVTGKLYSKDELVAVATIGKSTVSDDFGYLLDEDGNRCIESGKAPKLVDTEGETVFQQVELGSYYISEITPADGYMLDTTEYRGSELNKYYVTFEYSDETDAVICRVEQSKDDANLLVLDDALETDAVYSGDFVQKQAAQFVKLEDTNTSTEKDPIVAGFSLYLISDLAKVADGTIVPAGDAWTKADMSKFSDYDFSNEQTALLYKRQSEDWTEADEQWLVAEGTLANAYRVAEMFTDANGYLCTPELPVGQYVLIETTVPEGKRMADPVLITILGDSADPQPTRYIGDETTETYLRLVKTDSDALNSDLDTVLKAGAAYRIKLTSGVNDFDTEVWKVDNDGYIWYYSPALNVAYGSEESPFTTKVVYAGGKVVDAYIELDQLLPVGEYELVEVGAPDGYVLPGNEQKVVDTSSGRYNSYEFVDDAPAVTTVSFVISNDTVYPEGQLGDNKHLNEDQYGRLILTVEQQDQEQMGIFEISKLGEQLASVSEAETSLKDRLDGSEWRNILGTNTADAKDYVFNYELAPVEGAVFEVYAAEDIYTQQIDTSLLEVYGVDLDEYKVWSADDLVGTITTDRNGWGYLADLYIGKYYVKEATAGDGFVLNDKVLEFEVTSADTHQSFTVYEGEYENERQKVEISATKRDAETQEPVSGAIFGLIVNEDVVTNIEVGTEGSYVIADNATTLVNAGQLVATAISDENGVAKFNCDLPLVEYSIVELEAPLGYTSEQPNDSIKVDASYTDQEVETQVYGEDNGDIVFYNQKTKSVYTKSDIVSGALLSDAVLEIREIKVDESGNLVTDEDGNYVTVLVDSFVSDKDEVHYFYENDEGFMVEIESEEDLPDGEDLITKHGHLIEGLKEGRQYIFREITAPYGYVGYDWSDAETREANREQNLAVEEVRFTVEGSNIVAEHSMMDQRVVGALAITKEGEVVQAAEKSFLDQVLDFFKTVFTYVFGRVEGAEFEVYAAEDIYSVDQTGDLDTFNDIELAKDTLVATITTGVDGIAKLEGLPLGSYYFKEVGAGDGNYLLNDTIVTVTLEYAGQETPVVSDDSTQYVNDRQRVELTVTKKSYFEDEYEFTNTDEIVPEEQEDLTHAGAVFGLYNSEDILGFEVNDQGIVYKNSEALIEADTLIERIMTGEDGSITFTSDLPSGKYYIKELVAPDGYLLSEEVYEFDASYTGQDGEAIVKLSYDYYDKPVIIALSKLDITDESEVVGAHIQIVEKDNHETIVDEWTSDETVHYAKHLELNKTYIMTEVAPGDGYATAEDIEFTLVQSTDDEGNLLLQVDIVIDDEYINDGVIAMKDERTKLEITKTDMVTGEPVIGAELELRYVSEDEDVEDELIDTWITEETPHYIEKLKVGKYELTETKTPEGSGYVTAETIEFEVLDTGEIQKVDMEDDITKLQITKTDMITGEPVIGAELELRDSDDTLIDTWVTTKEPYYIERLTPGEYTLTELRVPDETGYLVAEEVVFTVEDTGEIQTVDMKDDVTKLMVRKLDGSNNSNLAGAKLKLERKLADGTYELIEEFTTTNEDKLIYNLAPGNYRLTELEAPAGYYTAQPVEFEVLAVSDVQKVQLIDGKAGVKTPTDDNNTNTQQEDVEGDGGGFTGDSGIVITALAVAVVCATMFLVLLAKSRKKEDEV